METDNLTTLTEMALANARRLLETTPEIVRVALQAPDGRICWLPMPPGISAIMNDGGAKDLFYGVLREHVERTGATAVVVVNDAWVGVPTEKQERMGREEPAKLKAFAQGASFNAFIEAGLATRSEALVVTVQNAREARVITHAYERTGSGIVWGQRTEHTYPQGDFDGRLKMFGDPPGEVARKHKLGTA